MGTNYYLEAQPACKCCGRPFERLHIGKSSAGWVFALKVHPDLQINDLPDWYELWVKPESKIEDEYGKSVSADEMLAVVLGRFGRRHQDSFTQEWLVQNGAEIGPYKLARAKIGTHCVGHGLGTYSLHTGDFS
jgi:hypothetical protein